MSNLGREMAKGAAWMVSMRFVIRAIGLVSMVILARLLVPEDFGLVVLATMLYGLIEIMGQFGFDVVLIQNQSADRRHYDTAWTLTVIRNLVLAGLLVAGARWAAGFFEEPRLAAILYWLALAAFVEGFANIGVVNFRKELQFHKDFAFMLGAKLGMFMVAVPLAFIWRDYWALVAGIVAGAFVRVALGYLMQPYRPRFSLAMWLEIVSFSKWLVANNILGFAYNRSDTFIIGKIVGVQSLGLYTIAHEIASLPTSELIAPVRRALLPVYAKMANDLESLRSGFLNVFSLALLIGLPVAAGIGLTADPLVRVLLGEKWLDSIPIIQVLTIHGFLSVISAGSGPVYLALGKPQLLTVIFVVGLIVMLPLLVWSVGWAGAYGAAWAIVTAMAIAVVVDLFLVLRLLRLPVVQLAKSSWRPTLSAAAMAFVVIGIQNAWPETQELPLLATKLAAAVAAGAVTYVGVQLMVWRTLGKPDGAEKHVLAALRVGLLR